MELDQMELCLAPVFFLHCHTALPSPTAAMVRCTDTLEPGVKGVFNQMEKSYRAEQAYVNIHSLMSMRNMLCVNYALFECFICSSYNYLLSLADLAYWVERFV